MRYFLMNYVGGLALNKFFAHIPYNVKVAWLDAKEQTILLEFPDDDGQEIVEWFNEWAEENKIEDPDMSKIGDCELNFDGENRKFGIWE